LIEKELKRSLLDPVRTKYVWLGRYHNEAVHDLLGVHGVDLKIDC